MKKTTVFLVCVLFVCLLLIGFCCSYWKYILEIPSRFAKIHNVGTISVTIDGEKYDLENTDIIFAGDTDAIFDSTKILNDQFNFKKGIYGQNTFSFVVPYEEIGEIKIEFGQFNRNWWHVCEYAVKVEIDTENGVNAKMNLEIIVEGESKIFDTTKSLTTEDNIISNLR